MTRRGADTLHTQPAGITAIRLLALFLLIAWALTSVTRGGLRQAVAAAWSGVRSHGKPQPGQPDARGQWAGPYYDALDVVAHQPFGANTTIAAALFQSDRPTFASAMTPRMYEAIYCLYPRRVDFYVTNAAGVEENLWFDSPKSQVPKVPPLWGHAYVVWTDIGRSPEPPGYRLLFANREARIYQAANH